MNIKVYVLMINENALDGFPYKQDILVFCDKGSCLKWLAGDEMTGDELAAVGIGLLIAFCAGFVLAVVLDIKHDKH
ncbi:hypothetical protein [Limosilactobacillus antri]|uniref:hypothetical protein n=1 Tax=Limosilactobacillus antri TaxID=227943 RepID=UPI001F599B94|nr:hypothetical protein [Limosilactobacillus antri]